MGPLSEIPLPGTLQSELAFKNTRITLCRKGHSLQHANSLSKLVNADWISTTVTETEDAELGPLLAALGLPTPMIRVHVQSSLTMTLAVAHTDLLVMVPQQWRDFPTTRELLEEVRVKESLNAPAIYVARGRQLPLTPAAQHNYFTICCFGSIL